MSDTESGSITFTERHDPALLSGTYTITVSQTLASTVKPSAKEGPIDETHQGVTRRFAVAGPRFTLSPTEITGQFPPPNSQGVYPSALPQIAFGRLTLPWARTAGGKLPWLALLVLDAAEGIDAMDAQVGLLQRKPFQPDPQTKAGPLGPATASYADANAAWAPEHGQALTDRCRCIELPVERFAALAPSADDMTWLTHTRHVTDGTDISLVVANRTPPVSASATAHLVSLEGLSEWLPARDGTPASITVNGNNATAVRLVSLASWTFSAVAPEETFAGRLGGVSCGVLSLPAPEDAPGTATETARRAIDAGYCPLTHHTRGGADAVSWYRGPFVPGLPEAGSARPTASADDLLRYDPSTGMLDASYAAAWELGRLLMIATPRVSAALRAWKARVSQRTALAAEADLIRQRVGVTDVGALLNDRVAGALQAAPATAEPGGAVGAVPSLFGLINQAVEDIEALADLHADATLPAGVASWFEDLASLEGVPLGYLVPDDRLLPARSDGHVGAIRFFGVDAQWITALVEGAFSIGRTSSAQAATDLAASGAVADTVPDPPASGFLLRSSVVDDWSGIVVTAFDSDDKPLHVDQRRLGPGLMLALMSGPIASVELHEHPTALHLEIGDGHVVRPRYVTVPAGVHARIADEITGADPIDVEFRGGRVVQVAALADALEAAVDGAGANTDGKDQRPFTSAELALQLTRGADGVRFEVGP